MDEGLRALSVWRLYEELGRSRKTLPSEVQPIIEISKNIPERAYRVPTEADSTREQKVLELLQERFHRVAAEGIPAKPAY